MRNHSSVNEIDIELLVDPAINCIRDISMDDVLEFMS